MQDFAALLIEARERKGITQAQLATSAGLTPSYLSLIENRKKPPPSDAVCERLAQVLGVSARELLEIAHLQRAPTTVQRRLSTLSGALSRERRSRGRILESLLSPFLLGLQPGLIDFEWLGGNLGRRHRLKKVLTTLGRHHKDKAAEVSRLVEELPERDRELLLEALPRILSRDRRGAAAPEFFYALPAPEKMPKRPFLLAWALGPSGDELREGDVVLVDPTAEPTAGDLVVLREPGGGGAVARRLAPAASEQQGSPAAGAQQGETAVGVVIEIRRPVRKTGA